MSNVMNPDGTHKVIAGYSHAAGLQERDRRIAELEAENAKLREAAQTVVYNHAGPYNNSVRGLKALLEAEDEDN